MGSERTEKSTPALASMCSFSEALFHPNGFLSETQWPFSFKVTLPAASPPYRTHFQCALRKAPTWRTLSFPYQVTAFLIPSPETDLLGVFPSLLAPTPDCEMQ